jgi:arylsulfatase A-like enzyme
VTPGRLPEPVSVTDLAPTACALLDVDLPGADGSPISGLLAAAGSRPAAVADREG